MIHAAVTDVVAPAVAADDPLRLLDQQVFHRQNLLAGVAAAGLHHRDEPCRHLGRTRRRTARFDPLLHHAFQLVGALRAFGDRPLHEVLYLVALLLHAHVHTQTEFGIVLEERVGPRRALSLRIGAVGSRRRRTRVDRRTARSIGHHHPFSEQLRNQFDIRSFTTTGTSTGELEQRLSEL